MDGGASRIRTDRNAAIVLLIIGAGHGKILNGLAADDPQFCLADTVESLKSTISGARCDVVEAQAVR